MKKGWKEKALKDICEKGSSSLKQKDVQGKNGQYPVYGASGIIGYIDTYQQKYNYIAIVKDGSIGRVSFMPAKSSVIGTMQYILPKKGFDINYIGYCLQSIDLSKYKQGAAIPHIYFRDYGERVVNVTENINEQKRIVKHLDSAFTKIDALKANAKENLNNAQALFQAELNNLLTKKKGWKEKALKDICEKGSSSLKQKDVQGKNGQYPVYGASGIIGYIDTYQQKYNYIAIVKDGSGIGRISFMPAKSSVIGTMQYILPKKGFDINYIGYCLQSIDLSKYKQGAAIPHIYFRDYGERVVNVTENINEQKQIVKHLDFVSAKVEQIKANSLKIIADCNALKQALLKQIFE